MSINVWKYAVKDVNDIKEKGLCGWYSILINGVNCYSDETEQDYLNNGYTVLSEDEFTKLVAEYEDSICGHWKEIAKEDYNNALNVLPPVRWYNGGFYISEAYTANIHDFYQEWGGKYYTSLQRITRNRDAIICELKVALESNQIEDCLQEMKVI